MAISITKRREFIHHVFSFFGIEESESRVITYDMALTTKYPVDWEAFYRDIVKTADKKALPMPKYFSDKISRFKKASTTGYYLENGSPVRVYLKNGCYYDFEVNSFVAASSLEDVKKRFEYKDENNKTATKIEKIVIFPKEATLIGESVFYNVRVAKKAGMTDEEYDKKVAEKENELKAKVKAIYFTEN